MTSCAQRSTTRRIIRVGTPGPPGASVSGNYQVDNFIVTAQMLTDRGVTLSAAALTPSNVELSIYTGIEQRANIDFQVTGSFLSWASLAMELLIDVGTAFTVRYQK